MENQILQQILAEMKNMNQRLDGIESGQARLEERQTRLESGQAKLEEGQARLEAGQEAIKKELRFVWDDIKRLDTRLTDQETFVLKRIK